MIKQYYYKTSVRSEFECFDDTEKVIDALVCGGHTVYSVAQKSNQLIPYHEHPSEEMVIVLSGRVRYIIEEDIVDLEEGDIIRIAPHSVHAMVGMSENGIANLLLVFI